MYGIKSSDVRFEFDGDAVKDTHTPQALDMEDDNVVDAKVSYFHFCSRLCAGVSLRACLLYLTALVVVCFTF